VPEGIRLKCNGTLSVSAIALVSASPCPSGRGWQPSEWTLAQ
jgi:hypothetical protein